MPNALRRPAIPRVSRSRLFHSSANWVSARAPWRASIHSRRGTFESMLITMSDDLSGYEIAAARLEAKVKDASTNEEHVYTSRAVRFRKRTNSKDVEIHTRLTPVHRPGPLFLLEKTLGLLNLMTRCVNGEWSNFLRPLRKLTFRSSQMIPKGVWAALCPCAWRSSEGADRRFNSRRFAGSAKASAVSDMGHCRHKESAPRARRGADRILALVRRPFCELH